MRYKCIIDKEKRQSVKFELEISIWTYNLKNTFPISEHWKGPETMAPSSKENIYCPHFVSITISKLKEPRYLGEMTESRSVTGRVQFCKREDT